MPRVGSSSTSTSTSWCSSRADRHLLLVAAGQLADRLARAPRSGSPRRSIHRAAARVLPRRQHRERRARDGSSRVSVMLSATLKPSASPSPRAILAEHAHPLPPPIVRRRTVRNTRRRVTRPLFTGSRPKIARSSRVRPAPSSPAMPRISPRRSVKRRSARHQPVELQDRLARRRARRADTDRRARVPPSGRRSRRPRVRRSGRSPALRPSRSTTNRSDTSFTSSMKCEM